MAPVPARVAGLFDEGITIFEDRASCGTEADPTSGECWPSGYALAAELVDIAASRGGTLAGVRLLELGCGSGVASLAARRLGADVVAVDASANALELLKMGVDAQGAAPGSLASARLDFTDEAAMAALFAEHDRFDAVVAADVLYDQKIAAGVGAALRRRCPPAALLLVDPGRTHGRRRFLETFAEDFFAHVFDPVPASRQQPTFRGEPAAPSDGLGRLGVGLGALYA